LEELLQKYELPKQYVIFVGTLQPRKNIKRLIRAYQTMRTQLRQEFGLVIVGRAGWGCDSTVNFIQESAQKDKVKWLKYLPQDHVETLVKGASCLALPSLAEGFGLPVVEAFAAGVPVLTSNTTSLPEVAADAAWQVDPTNVEDIADGLEKILDDKMLSEQLKIKGSVQARQFSWERTAKETVAVYRSLLL
jgi:alpha-1,3-rhamnosyl/mannosyltransferase